MTSEVGVTAWAIWDAGGVSINEAPVPGNGAGLGLWSERPRSTPGARGRALPANASALVQLAQQVLAARRVGSSRFAAGDRREAWNMNGSKENDLAFLQSLSERGESLGSPSLFVHTLSTAALAEVSLALGCRGAVSTVSNGEASGLLAVALEARALAAGRSAACLCGAMDVCGSDSDVIALFLLEPARSDSAVPRLSGWELTFDTTSPPSPGSLRSSMERLVLALCSDEGGPVSASSGTGESVRLSVVPAGRSARSGQRVGRAERA
jgi:hypothetical protein